MKSEQYRIRKTINIGNDNFILPFRATGFSVDDSSGTVIAECRSQEVAKELVKILNRYSQNEA